MRENEARNVKVRVRVIRILLAEHAVRLTASAAGRKRAHA